MNKLTKAKNRRDGAVNGTKAAMDTIQADIIVPQSLPYRQPQVFSPQWHEMILNSGPVAWCMLDTGHVLINELTRLGLISTTDQNRIDLALQKTFISMQEATYWPRGA